MDALVQIVQSLSKNEVTEFTSFINRQKRKQNRKDLELFLLFQKHGELAQTEVLKYLYPNGNVIAYHALRKKLLKHLSDYILFKQLREDDTTETQVTAYISLARYLKDHDINKLAWKYLKKAEQMAVKAELFALANQIMRLFLEMPLIELKQEIEPLLKSKAEYLQLAIEDDKADTAYKIIQHYLKQSKTRIDAPNMQDIIEDTLRSYNLKDAMVHRPSMIFKLMSIARSAATSGKDYYHFEPMVLAYYSKMIVPELPTERDKIYVARLQYMVAHTLFRNKKFSQSITYIQLLKAQFQVIVKTEYTRLLPRYTQLHCATLFFTGHIKDAIDIANNTLIAQSKLSPNDILNLELNQAIYYLYDKQYRQAAKILNSIGHSNVWCAKVAGIEWVIKKDILDVFIQFELENFDIASNKIRALLRQKEWFDNLPQLNRVKVFLQLLNKVVDEPNVAETDSFYWAVEDSFDWVPIEQEDLHASVYYAWLKSKIVKQDAYQTLLDLISIEDTI